MHISSFNQANNWLSNINSSFIKNSDLLHWEDALIVLKIDNTQAPVHQYFYP